MKYILGLILLVFGFFLGFSQTDENPAIWTYEAEKISDTEYNLIIKADIYEGWHIYSQFTDENGSLPSELAFEKVGEDYELVGSTTESETLTEYSDIFEVDETFFKEKAVFTQKIKLLNPEITQVEVGLFYQICKEVCIPKDEIFHISLTGGSSGRRANRRPT